MSLGSELRERARALLFGAAEEREMAEELRFHLEQETARNVRAGLGPRAARRRALIAFGGVDRFSEQVREARGTLRVENLLRDVRLGVRSLRRTPGFTVVAVLTLAVGIGATTAVFALANWLLIRPVPGVAAPEALIVVRLEQEPGRGTGISHANIEDLRAAAPALAGLAGHRAGASLQVLAPDGSALAPAGDVVQGDYFGVLGVKPILGRGFTEAERAPGAAGDVVVVSERFWRTHLDADPAVLGTALSLNAGSFTIVGVAPPGFHGPERTDQIDLWLPPAAYPGLRHTAALDPGNRRQGFFFELIGRLQPGASSEEAEAQLRAAMAHLVEAYPEENTVYERYIPTVYRGVGLPVLVRERTAGTLRLLLGVVCLLLLIACANVANLLLFRGAARRAESAVRRALGASSGRVLQQQVVEGLLLSLAGGAAGVAFALLLRSGLEGQSLFGLPPVERIALDWRVLGFALGGAILGGALATALPALAAVRANLLAGVKGAEGKGRGYGAVGRGALTILQVAASLTLLIGALLLVRTARNLGRVELGFDAAAVLTFMVNPAPQGYDASRAQALERQLLDRLAGLPGTRVVSLGGEAPFRSFSQYRVGLPDGPEPVLARPFAVSADYFATLGLPFLAGRGFSVAQQFDGAEAEGGVVLSASLARTLFEGADAVGRVVEVHGFRGATRQVVLGVTGDLRATGLRGPPTLALHLPLGAATQSTRFVLLRSTLPHAQAERLAREALASLDPSIPLTALGTLSEVAGRYASEERLLARLLGLFALLAAALAAIGLYGVIAYSVARRRREIGVRLALGASGRAVVGLVARHALLLVAVGSVVGTAGGYALSRVLASRLFGVTPVDPATYAAAIAAFLVVALAASALPARAATKVDPVATLKAE